MATFWGEKENVRHKIGGLVHGEMIDAEVTAAGITFFRRGSSEVCGEISWGHAFYESHPKRFADLAATLGLITPDIGAATGTSLNITAGAVIGTTVEPSPLNESAGLRIELVPDEPEPEEKPTDPWERLGRHRL